MTDDKTGGTGGADKITDRVSGLAGQAKDKASGLADKAAPYAGQAKDKASELAKKAAPHAEKAGNMAATGVDAAASSLDKVTGGRFSGHIKSVSGKLSHLLDPDHSHDKTDGTPPPSGTDAP